MLVKFLYLNTQLRSHYFPGMFRNFLLNVPKDKSVNSMIHLCMILQKYELLKLTLFFLQHAYKITTLDENILNYFTREMQFCHAVKSSAKLI